MSYQTQKFESTTPDQANAYGIALNSMISARLNEAKAIEQEEKNPLVQRQAIADAILREQEGRYKGQENKWYEQNIRSEIGYRNAGAGHLNAETKYMPLEALVKTNNSLNSTSRFGKAYQLKQSLAELDPSTRAAWISQHQSEYNDMLSSLSDSSAENGHSQINHLLNQQVASLYPGYNAEPPQGQRETFPQQKSQGNMDQQETSNQQQGGIPPGSPPMAVPAPNMQSGSPLAAPINNELKITPPGTSADIARPERAIAPLEQKMSADPELQEFIDPMKKRAFASTPEMDDQLKLSSQDFANRKAVGSVINNRADAAAALETWLADNRGTYAPRLKNAAQFAGPTGRAKLLYQAALPESLQSQAFKDHVWVKDTFSQSLANLVKQMEKLNGDQQQRKELKGLTNTIDKISLGEKGAIQLFNRTIASLQDLSRSVFKAAEPKFPGTNEKKYGLKNFGDNYIPSNIEPEKNTSASNSYAHLSNEELDAKIKAFENG